MTHEPKVFSSLDKSTKDWLYISQRELEIESVDRGVARYRAIVAGKTTGTTPADFKLMGKWMPYLTKAIEIEQARITDRMAKMSSLGEHEYILCSMDADKLAFITLATLFQIAQKPDDCPVLTASLAVASNVKIQRYIDVMRQTDRDAFKMLKDSYKRINKRVVAQVRRKMQIANIEWPLRTRARLGAWLCSTAIECTQCFEILRVKESGTRGNGGRTAGFGFKTVKHLALTKSAREEIEKWHDVLELMNPYGLPMVVPPIDWDDQNAGGYLCLKNTMVKGTFEESINKPSDTMRYAVNMSQRTEWRINKRIADIMRQVWESGGGVAGIPGRELKELPPKPAGFDPKQPRKKRWATVDPEVFRKWMDDANAVHSYNNTTVGLRYQMLFKLDIAKRFSKYPALYFPYQVDWRGRAYPIPAFVNPQADDTGRALLEFARGVALGKHGFYWLCLHTANLLGYDKDSMSTRLQVLASRCASDLPMWFADPMANRGWMDGDDPFKCLAAVFDLMECIRQHGMPKEWTRKGMENHAKEYESRTPVAIDGSCNGLQHYSAIGLDPVGGRATNLVPGPKPEDIYRLVADVVNATIEQDCGHTEDTTAPCHAWRGHITRKTVKRAVMTTPYGVTKQGIMRQFIKDRHTDEIEGLAYKNANYLKQVVYDAVSHVVVAARLYMSWLQDVANILGERNQPVEWVTPAGFAVRQAYTSKNRRQIRDTALGCIDYRVSDEDQSILVSKQIRSIAPNYVHSMDASHMYLVMNVIGKEHDITDFGPVHDSYACHAGYMNVVAYQTRHQFFLMHKASVLQHTKQYLEQLHKIKLPEIPPRGDLDLHGVYQSEYFFH